MDRFGNGRTPNQEQNIFDEVLDHCKRSIQTPCVLNLFPMKGQIDKSMETPSFLSIVGSLRQR